MTVYSSRFISYSLIFFQNFLTGVEYAVILPTALQYLKRFNGNQLDLGFCLSAYSLSSLISSPLMGKWSDKIDNTKIIMIFANLWQIAGSFMYFAGLSTIFIISGRLVAGVGLGVLGCTFGDIVKTTEPPHTSQILSRIMIGRQLGMIVGPAFNFILLDIDYQLGPFKLDNLSAPGLFMAVCWFVLQVLVIFFYKNLSDFVKEEAEAVAAAASVSSTTPSLSVNVSKDEKRPLLDNTANKAYESTTPTTSAINDDSNSSKPKYDRVRIVDNSEAGSLLSRLYHNYIKEEIVTVYSTTFTVFFMQTSLETLLTPFTRDYFKWNDIQNSIFYGVAGLDIMIVFLVLSFLSKHIRDRTLLLVGIIGNMLSLIFLIVYLPTLQPNDESSNTLKNIALFMLPVFANVTSLPLIVLSSISLLSKLTSKETQGLTQGIRRTVAGIACILGPNWSGAFYGQWYILVGSLIAILMISLIMTLLSFKYLKPAEHTAQNRPSSEHDNDNDSTIIDNSS